jgi:superfamily II DNA or RNA helicase
MVMAGKQEKGKKGLRARRWLLSYRTSSTVIEGRPVRILHDFYLPALRLAVSYDRVAGYFRSSSLAAASQGFSAFVGRGGRMRLIVGADLDPEDVQAILAGDAKRLAKQLNRRLEQPAAGWPEEERNGVTLLAWMVAHGYLEVRVAFRVHGNSGVPLPFEAVEDGYVHEKWFVLGDGLGNRLYGAGTLNESKTALVLNAENIDIHCDWWGKTDRLRVENAAAAFENLWEGQVPHMKVMTLPEAVRQRLVQLAAGVEYPVEADGSSDVVPDVQPPPALERLRFAVLKDGPRLPGGRFVGLETAPVAPWPHQEIVARRLVEAWPHSFLLCDEVGLGKTIEAGLAFRSLYLSGLARRILVAAPASLTEQWQRQMASKLLLSFGRVLSGAAIRHGYIFPMVREQAAASLYEPDLTIISTGLLARVERRKYLMEAETFDIALVDEAHNARRQNPVHGPGGHPVFGQIYTTLRDGLRQKARSLWLATATPLQIDPVEPCDLLALTNRAGAFQFDPTLTLQYYDILFRVGQGEDPSAYDWDFLRQAIKALQRQDPLFWQYLQGNVVDGRIRTGVRQWLEHKRVPRGRDRELISRFIFSAAPLSRVMLRHTRRLLEIYRDNGQLRENLPQRHILKIPRIVFTAQERRMYNSLEQYCKGLSQQVTAEGNRSTRTMMGLLLNFLRLRFASSLFALRETIQRRLVKVEATLQYQVLLEEESNFDEPSPEELFFENEYEDDRVGVEFLLKNRTQADLNWERSQLQKMLQEMADLTGSSSKMQYLFKVLDKRWDKSSGRIRQTVIFTRFYDTLTDIVNRLRQRNPQMFIGTYSGRGGEYFDSQAGGMKAVHRDEVKERFLRGEIDILVCTDAAAEGLNLQTADLLVNFDLGWNPMKVEQRIGRIDRIGQKYKDIYVLNLCYADNAEYVVYGRLLKRLADANMIVGTQQFSLLPVGPENFQALAEGSITPEALEIQARERMKKQRRHMERVEINPAELYHIYRRRAQSDDDWPAPVNLASIWEALSSSTYLRGLGCSVSQKEGQDIFTVSGIDGVPEGTVLTISRDLLEKGLVDTQNPIHFASYGDPQFNSLVDDVTKFDLPACVRRIVLPVPGMDGVSMVGYAAVELVNGDMRSVRFIRCWDDLENLNLAEEETLADEEVAVFKQELEQRARQEFQPYLAAEHIERENVKAALAQELLSLLVIHSFLRGKARFAGKKALFGPLMGEIEALFEEREPIIADDLPAEVLRTVADDLLFDLQIPKLGDKFHLRTPRVLGRAAMDAGRRIADSMKVGKSELSVTAMLARLKREADKRLQKLN